VVPAPAAAAGDRRLALLAWPDPTCREGNEEVRIGLDEKNLKERPHMSGIRRV
jgi:hypothetical protein